MAAPRVDRRLAAVLAADVVGYSRLMGRDEQGTHDRLKAHLCGRPAVVKQVSHQTWYATVACR